MVLMYQGCIFEILFSLVYVNEKGNEVAESAVNSAIGYIEQSGKYNLKLEVTRVSGNRNNDSNEMLKSLCENYHRMLDNKRPPHLVLDTTMTDMASETVKIFTRGLALPTISASYGQNGDLREWNNLDIIERKYLIQVSPPADLIPEMIRKLVVRQLMISAAIMYDKTFVMDHKHQSLLRNIATRHLISEINPTEIDQQLLRMIKFDLVNFFILGSLETIKLVLDSAWKHNLFNKNKKYAFYILTQDLGDLLECEIKNGTIFFGQPSVNKNFKSRLDFLKKTYFLDGKPEMTASFYFDLSIQAFLTVRNMMIDGTLYYTKNPKYITCDEYNKLNKPTRAGLDLEVMFKMQTEHTIESPSFGNLVVVSNGLSSMRFEMNLNLIDFRQGHVSRKITVGNWMGGIDSNISDVNSKIFDSYHAVLTYRVVVAEQTPFIFRDPEHPKGYNGYCIDLMDKIGKLAKFEYEVILATNNEFGHMDEKGHWNGLIKDLMDKKADIGLGPISVMEERESVIDFTVPYYDLVGITILMKIPYVPTSLFKFLGVLEDEVWYCIIAAYFFTSFLLWIFDRMSPMSYRNNPEKYENDNDNRDFTLKECLWFCMTSLTPQGGGEAPKNSSGRFAAGAWWLFGFIIISSYTANLAAFLTVSRLETPIESLDDLAKQYKIQYAPMNGSQSATYFLRMKNIEKRFYEIWKDMSLNRTMNDTERAKLAVWDYPVSQRYSKMWIAMTQAGFPKSLEEAVKRVRDSPSSSEGFAYLGDGTDIKYLEMTNCDLKPVGEEFSRKPYALALPEGSSLKNQLNTAILMLLNMRELEHLKEKWWNKNPNKIVCDEQDNQSDGISIQNIGGVFIIIFVGIGISLVTLAFEYWWIKCRKPSEVTAIEVLSRSENERH
ncbi:LOW QUALITY PROTEIN: ionotropic receptor 25a-like [Harmonia axyridis]|uniref:LOW QUALITY PROTEIN: ionotropic receptor 25a-like n=1 Tax=Harmonia axyridis TaxID=115357 RepID=UPI001E2780ED|nr:LOW QUALITY PROTEIN: ionotropic receptor 25a-like [Harmonia axyridis]